jgi:hypothetical protein
MSVAWSRRPVQALLVAGAQERLGLGGGEVGDQVLLVVLGVMASTRWIVAACSGWRSAAQTNRERTAASRLFRVRGPQPTACST